MEEDEEEEEEEEEFNEEDNEELIKSRVKMQGNFFFAVYLILYCSGKSFAQVLIFLQERDFVWAGLCFSL